MTIFIYVALTTFSFRKQYMNTAVKSSNDTILYSGNPRLLKTHQSMYEIDMDASMSIPNSKKDSRPLTIYKIHINTYV